ncbi:MAG: Serine/threonine protein kinase [candidate division TM6 bacterium GW2011_GWF2_28_16]|jgi:serine/threonine-protein kinase|nr:MAG: Serine/threonine protein kinase [candidate division TM6 bacterium GW2011_GWF2_28_16]
MKNFIKQIFWIIPFIIFIFGYFVISIILPKKEVTIPNIIGKNLQESVLILSNNSLNLTLVKEIEKQDLPDGIILSQDPASGNRVKKSQNIFVTVSKKSKVLSTPNFIGLNYKKVRKLVSKLNVEAKYYWLESIYPVNSIIAQNPAPDTNLENKKINLYISKGLNSLYIIPNFKGISLNKLLEVIDQDKINLEILYKNNFDINNQDISGLDKDNIFVIDQRPVAGSIVNLDKKIYLSVQVS